MKQTIYLIRHGEKEKIVGDPGLSNIGQKQAMMTAKYFQNHKIKAVYTSPLLRAKQTARYIATELNIPIITEDCLTERLNWGDRENESFTAFLHEWGKTNVDRNYQPQNGRSSTQTGNEVLTFINSILEKKEQFLIVVTHGGTIEDLLRTIFPDKSLSMIINQTKKDQYIQISECSITILNKEENKFSLKEVNFTKHLE